MDDGRDDDYNAGMCAGYSRRKRHEGWAGVGLLYGVAGLLTFAYVYENSAASPYEAAEKNVGSVIAGGAWPVYWAGRGALWVVRNAQPKPVKEGALVVPSLSGPIVGPLQDGPPIAIGETSTTLGVTICSTSTPQCYWQAR